MIVRVEMAAWEVQCCQPAPATGQWVQWQLRWRPGQGPAATVLPWTAEPAAQGWSLTLGDITAYAYDEPDLDSPGTLVHTTHGDLPEDLVTTTGTVQRVQVLEQPYRGARERSRQSAGWRLRDTAGPPRTHADGSRDEVTAYVVHLRVP